MSAQPITKFEIKKIEKFTRDRLKRNMKAAAVHLRNNIRAFTPEDTGTLVKAIKHEVKSLKTMVVGLAGVDKTARLRQGLSIRTKDEKIKGDVFVTDYAKRIEEGFYGEDAKGRVHKRQPGVFMFRKGKKHSRNAMTKLLAR